LLFCPAGLPLPVFFGYNSKYDEGSQSRKGTIVAMVLGYHGCEAAFARDVRSGRIALMEWKPSRNPYDWLGEGIYFWEASRTRAEQWAAENFGEHGDVLEVEIDLGQCLDLLESTYHGALREVHKNLRTAYGAQGLSLPKNRKKLHDLDCLVINRFVELAEQQGIHFQTVRGVFEDGRPLFPGSVMRTQSHIQIAVRDNQRMRIRDATGGEA
jgi:hypothetical protein